MDIKTTPHNLKLNEQIAFLRKQKEMTQEELALALGVTNQSVSKWENNICCPDITLLPKIAQLFNVSVDALLGCNAKPNNQDIVLLIKENFNSISKSERADFAFKAVTALHTLVLSDCIDESNNSFSDWDINSAMEHAAKSEWGYSCVYTPNITTTMKQNLVFFCNNKNIFPTNTDINKVCSIIKAFYLPDNMKIAVVLYQLTVSSEDIFVSIKEISEKSGLSEDKVNTCIFGDLLNFLLEEEKKESRFRFKGQYMNIVPILLLLKP